MTRLPIIDASWRSSSSSSAAVILHQRSNDRGSRARPTARRRARPPRPRPRASSGARCRRFDRRGSPSHARSPHRLERHRSRLPDRGTVSPATVCATIAPMTRIDVAPAPRPGRSIAAGDAIGVCDGGDTVGYTGRAHADGAPRDRPGHRRRAPPLSAAVPGDWSPSALQDRGRRLPRRPRRRHLPVAVRRPEPGPATTWTRRRRCALHGARRLGELGDWPARLRLTPTRRRRRTARGRR